MGDGKSELHESTRERLRRVPLFAELEDEDLDRLAGLSRIAQLRRKEMLFVDGEPYAGMYVILSGLAVVYKQSGDGRMLILHVCRPGDSVAEDPLFEEPEARYPAHGRVTRDSEVMFLPREKFLPFLKQHPEVAWEMLKGFAVRLRELSQQLEGVTLREVTARLARYLLSEIEKVRPRPRPPSQPHAPARQGIPRLVPRHRSRDPLALLRPPHPREDRHRRRPPRHHPRPRPPRTPDLIPATFLWRQGRGRASRR